MWQIAQAVSHLASVLSGLTLAATATLTIPEQNINSFVDCPKIDPFVMAQCVLIPILTPENASLSGNLTYAEPKEIPVITIIPTITSRKKLLLTPLLTKPSLIQNQNSNQGGNLELLQTVNTYRKEHGLATLANREDLCVAATTRSQEIARNFSHEGFQQAIQGINYTGVAENIWQGELYNSKRVIEAWNSSLSHQDNLLGNWEWGCGNSKQNSAVFLFLR
jgi:uncharacterized protein YkwD